jgi:hypothetical protein
LEVPIRTFLWEGWVKITLCSIPFAIVSALADRYWHPHSLVAFFSEILITLPVYAAFVLIIFREEVMTVFRMWQQSRRMTAQATP